MAWLTQKEELRIEVEQLAEKLRSFWEYNNYNVKQIFERINAIYFEFKKNENGLLFVNLVAESGIADVQIKAMKWYSSNSIPLSDENNAAYKCFKCFWDFSVYTDSEYNKLIGTKGMVPILLAMLRDFSADEVNMKKEKLPNRIKGCLTVTFNLKRIPENVKCFQAQNATEVLAPYMTIQDERNRALAVMALIGIMDESGQKHIEHTGVVAYLVDGIGKCVEKKEKKHRGIGLLGQLEGLEDLSINDANKKAIIDAGALSILTKVLGYYEDGYACTLRTIWNLCFDEAARKRALFETGLVGAVTTLLKSSTWEVKKAADGALWQLKGEQEHEEASSKDQAGTSNHTRSKTGHIMISYQWDDQKKVIELKDKLKSDGYKVWLDVEQMGGSTLDAMAAAVENASLVLLCISEKYMHSPNCRSEAEYAYKREKAYIPLMMQRHYDPKGWLGVMTGTKFYINFDGKYAFDKAYDMLLNEMQNQALVPTAKPPPATGFDSWTVAEVQNWLQNNELHKSKTLLETCDGKALLGFIDLYKKSPEYFCRCLRDEYKFGLLDVADLTTAMGALSK